MAERPPTILAADLSERLSLVADFIHAEPFPHVIVDGFADWPTLARAIEAWPGPDDPLWVRYESPVETHKRTMCERLPRDCQRLVDGLNSQEVAGYLGRSLMIDLPLSPDPLLHGGGLHTVEHGGRLDVHLDYTIHPRLNLERRLNLCLFATPYWQRDWGGCLQLWDVSASRVVKEILPVYNRAVIWEPSDISYHGHTVPVTAPIGCERRSIAVYYLASPRPGLTRRRALFVPSRL